MVAIYYKLSQAITFATGTTYIVGWFKKDGHYCFLSFESFDEFIGKKNNYNSLHSY